MDDPTQTNFQVFHTLWTAAITVGGGVVAFFTKRLFDVIDGKAEKTDLDELRAAIKGFVERQDRYHESNTQRLDKIIMELSSRDRGNWTGPERRR